MSSRNHNSRLHSNTQSANRPHLVGDLPIYVRQDEAESEPTSTIVSTNEDGSKEIPTVTKILIATCFAAILTPQVTTHSIRANLEIIFEWVAILSMLVGMYIQGKRPKLSMWLQRFGHLSCLVGLMLKQGNMLQLPLTYFWIPPFVAALILGTAMFFQAWLFN